MVLDLDIDYGEESIHVFNGPVGFYSTLQC